MARTVYSALLATATSVSAPESLGGPPSGYLWVMRCAVATFGSYLGYAAAAFSVGGEDPWLWLCESSSAKLVGFQQQSFTWEGRIVVPADTELWVKPSDGDTCDVLVSGYQLLLP